ncbi:hypothetical protein [Streptomyces sp. BE303]|uniref:hypothetical protein n=1 Tax=Streptomyces sp. BE303 TaxID=3002528 RepID=UPI002E784496|nr:hypothetical protein [Streptomyces sp. BE303]MED7951735.1 hypothetical protein [Streptomyces sp. BE303]
MSAPDIATALAGGADVELALLAVGAEAGRGGQGLVQRLAGYPGLLFKRYLDPGKVHGPALAELVALRLALPGEERDRLDAQAAWPLCRVVDGPGCVGFLMQEAPAAMSWQTGAGGRRLTEAQYLFYPEKPATQGVVRPDPEQRLALVLELAGLIERLHRWGLVIGDLSHANVLWSVVPEPAVHLLDCDGVRRVGAAPVLEQTDTPDWADPLSPHGSSATVDSDRYKAALLFGRTLAQDPYLTPGQPFEPLPDVLTDRQLATVRRIWDQAGGPYGTRPDLTAWLLALGGRGSIPLGAGGPARAARPVDERLFDGRAPRGSIPLRRPT